MFHNSLIAVSGEKKKKKKKEPWTYRQEKRRLRCERNLQTQGRFQEFKEKVKEKHLCTPRKDERKQV